jgi:leader peptidase (prepilin peptidase)/N-methyltransferase
MRGLVSIHTILYVFAFLYGAVVGSFVNVLIYRIPRKLNWVTGRSACPECAVTLKLIDLIPIVSYIILRGKCRYCGAKIPFRYTIVEMLNGLLYLAAFHRYGLTLYSLGWYIAMPALIALAFIDAEHRIIPDRFNIALAVAGLIMTISGEEAELMSRVIGIFAISVPFLAIAMISKGSAMGGGDIKLVAASGLCLGWQMNIVAVFIGSLLGSVYGVALMIMGKADRKSQIPFGPWLAAGIAISGMIGQLRF